MDNGCVHGWRKELVNGSSEAASLGIVALESTSPYAGTADFPLGMPCLPTTSDEADIFL